MSIQHNDRIVFPTTYHPVNVEVCKCVNHNFRKLQTDEEVGDAFIQKPMIAFRRGRNLRDILVRSHLPKRVCNVGSKKCGRSRCVTCKHIQDDVVVVGPSGTFTVKQSFTCVSSCLIYGISCSRCGSLYVGETGRRLGDRFREHRLDPLGPDQT